MLGNILKQHPAGRHGMMETVDRAVLVRLSFTLE
jgi:hypothetical protein